MYVKNDHINQSIKNYKPEIKFVGSLSSNAASWILFRISLFPVILTTYTLRSYGSNNPRFLRKEM